MFQNHKLPWPERADGLMRVWTEVSPLCDGESKFVAFQNRGKRRRPKDQTKGGISQWYVVTQQ